jgi:hypothetical protein
MGKVRGKGFRGRRKNAAESDVRRMYLRGRTGVLKVAALPLEEALAHAKTGPTRRAAKAKPLGSYRAVVAAVPSEATHPKSARKRKKTWAVGHLHSASVLRPKAQPKRQDKKLPATIEKPTTAVNPAPKLSALERRRLRRAGLDMKERSASGKGRPMASDNTMDGISKPKGSSPKVDGQPKWEDGYRILQAGRFESKRR